MNSIEVDPAVAAEMSEDELVEFYFAWGLWSRQEQWPPPRDWVTWLLMGGRGSGKTRFVRRTGFVSPRRGAIQLSASLTTLRCA